MSTQQMTLTWSGTPLVALAEDKLISLLLTINQSKMSKENMNFAMRGTFLSVCLGQKN